MLLCARNFKSWPLCPILLARPCVGSVVPGTGPLEKDRKEAEMKKLMRVVVHNTLGLMVFVSLWG